MKSEGMSCAGIRAEAWRTLWHRGDKWKYLLALLLLSLIPHVSGEVLQWFYDVRSIQTWSDFCQLQLQMTGSGLDCLPPSDEASRKMWIATGFSYFVAILFGAIASFGIAVSALKRLRRESRKVLSSAMRGFVIPMELAWIQFVIILRVAIWSMFFIVPGIIAMLRYAFVIFAKADDPSLSTTACLMRSCELTNGRKMDLFRLLCSFWIWFVPFILFYVAFCLIDRGFLSEDANLILVGASIAYSALFSAYFSLAQAVFYEKIKSEKVKQ